MKIKEYIQKNNLTWKQFGALVGISRQTVYNIMKRKGSPSVKTARRIEKATGGEVTINDIA